MATEKIIIKIETGGASAKVGKLNKGLESTNKSAKKTGLGLKGLFGGIKTGVLNAIPALNSLKLAMISTGVGALVVGVGALVGIFAKAAQKGAEFSKGLSTLRAVTGKTAEELEVVTEQAKELGATTAFTAKQVLDLQTELAKLGFTVSDIQNSTPAILDLAASLEVDLASAAAFAGSTVKGFGLDTEETQRVVDVMALSTSRSALDFEKLRESMKMVAPVASSAGVSIERTTALLGALADRGVSGSMAGTGLAKTFIELSKKGITLDDAMEKVNNSSNGLNTAIELVGINGGKALLNLASTGSDALNDLESQFVNAEGSAKKMAEIRLDNLEGDMTKLGSAWEGFLLGVEDGQGPLNKLQRFFVQGLTKAITGFGVVVDFVAFTFSDKWETVKLQFNGVAQSLKGNFSILGARIKLFANNALLQISKIPLIGRAVNKKEVQNNINSANEQLLNGQKQLADGVAKLREGALKDATRYGRFLISQQGKAERVQQLKENKKLQKQKLEQEKESEEDRKKRLEERDKELKKLAKIEQKYAKQSEDLQDTTDLAKAQRKRQRALKEIEQLKLTETEKREAIKSVNDYYDQIEKDAKASDDEKEKEDRLKKQEAKINELALTKEEEALSFEEQRELLNERRQLVLDDEMLTEAQKLELLNGFAEQESNIEERKRQEKLNTLNGIVKIAGEESAIGRAALIAKQMMATQELLIDLGVLKSKATKATAEASLQGAESGASVSTGFSKTLALGFPAAIGPLVGYGVAAAGIIQGVMSATKKTKSVASSLGGQPKGGGVSAPSLNVGASGGGQSQAPAFNLVGSSETNQLAEAVAGQSNTPIQTYVVSDDITTSQALERNIVNGASI